MKRSAFVVAAVVTAIACAAPAVAATCGDGTSFLDKVYILKPPFRPDIYGVGYKRPEDNGQLEKQSQIAQDLQAAFDAAPPFFRDRLCALTKVYVNPTGCANGDPYHCSLPAQQALDNSWGYRERLDQVNQVGGPPYQEYIATSAGLWKNGGQAPAFARFETVLLQTLLGWNAASYSSAVPDTPAMAVLAVLAHEYGHVLWYDTFNPNHILNFFEEPPGLCPNGASFFKGQWKGLTQTDIQPPKWRTFRASQNARPSDDASIGNPQSPLAGTLLYDAQRHDAPNTTRKLRQLFKNPGRWPSLFAAFAPDEDFVETFKFYVLLQLDRNDKPTSLTSLQLQMPDGTTANVPSDYAGGAAGSRPVLHRKMRCFMRLFPPP